MSDVVELLRGLVRIDTSNPPGPETPAAEYVRDFLQAAGIEAELVAKDPARANVVARLRGGSGPSLAFLGCRPLPGASKEDVERALEEFVDETESGALLAPTLSLGYTCSHVMREALGSVAYGFMPFRHQDPLLSQETKHGPNERILVADLELQAEAAYRIARSLAS